MRSEERCFLWTNGWTCFPVSRRIACAVQQKQSCFCFFPPRWEVDWVCCLWSLVVLTAGHRLGWKQIVWRNSKCLSAVQRLLWLHGSFQLSKLLLLLKVFHWAEEKSWVTGLSGVMSMVKFFGTYEGRKGLKLIFFPFFPALCIFSTTCFMSFAQRVFWAKNDVSCLTSKLHSCSFNKLYIKTEILYPSIVNFVHFL